MEFRLVILSIACFASLVPPALSTNLLAVKAVAQQAAENIASIGAETLAAKKAAVVKAASDIASIAASGVALKGQALKTAASSITGAMINGAASIGATIAKAGVNMLAAKFGAGPTYVLQEEVPVMQEMVPVLQEEVPVLQEVIENYPIEVPVQMPSISSVSVDVSPPVISLPPPPPKLSPIWSALSSVPNFEILGQDNSAYVYEIVNTPGVTWTGPLLQTFQVG